MKNDANLIELINLLQSIDASDQKPEDNAYVIYDADGRKILL